MTYLYLGITLLAGIGIAIVLEIAGLPRWPDLGDGDE